MKELTFSIQNKQEQELLLTLQGHRVPLTLTLGTSHMDLEMEDVDGLIKALHMMKSQHKMFVNVEPMGVQDLKKGEDPPSNRTNVYANLPTPPKVENKKDYVEYFKEQSGKVEIQQSTKTYLSVEDKTTDESGAEKKEIQLKVGQKYKDRGGCEFTIEHEVEPSDWRYERGYRFFARCVSSHKVRSYAANGRYLNNGPDHDSDLIEFIEDVPSQPDKDENGRWILNEGDTVMLSNGVEGMVVENDKSNLPYKIGYYDKGQTKSEWLYGTDDDKHTGYCIYITSIIQRAK